MGEACAVELVGRGSVGGKKFFLPGQFTAGKFGGGAGLGEVGIERIEFGGPLAFAQIGQAGGGLALGGEFGRAFEREEGRPGGDLAAF